MMNQPMPQAVDIEQRLLATILAYPDNMDKCLRLITAETFYNEDNRKLWIIIEDMHEKGLTVDYVIITQRLLDNKMDTSLVMDLLNKDYLFDIDGLINVLHKKYVRRKAIIEAYGIIQAAYDENKELTPVIQRANEAMLNAIAPVKHNAETANKLKLDLARNINDNLGKFQEVTGLPTGYENYDIRTGGFSFDGDLIIIAGRPGMGKTTVSLEMANNATTIFGKSGAFFSLEMSKKQLAAKMLASQTGIELDKLKKNKLNDFEAEHIFDVLTNEGTQDSEMFVDDTANASIHYIIAESHRLKKTYDIQYVFIDYLQLISCPQMGTRELEVSYISRRLKALSKELGIPVIALSQLSRSVEHRGGTKIPQLSDLRESGSLEQDASIVTFVYRPEYYGILEDENGNSLKGVTVLITAKNRHGDLGKDYLLFDGAKSNFVNFDYSTGNTISPIDYDMRLVEMQNYNDNGTTTTSFREKIGMQEDDDTPF